MILSHPQTVQILSIAFLWVMFLSAIRFSASTMLALFPLLRAVVRAIRWRMNLHDFRREWFHAVDRIQMRFSVALMTPWSLPFLLAGLALIGLSVSLLSSGDVMILVARSPETWANYNRYLDWVGSMAGGLGMAAVLAAISKRRTVSFMISTSFAITGLGIGIIAAVYV